MGFPTNLLILSYRSKTLMVKGLFGKVLKCRNDINKKKKENIGQEN